MNEIDKYLQAYLKEQNQVARKDFEGYSPVEMHSILYEFFSPKCPVQLQRLTEQEYAQIPLLQQIKHLIKAIKEDGGLKLTARGNLPVKVVKSIYAQEFMKDEFIEMGLTKVYKEEGIPTIRLTRIILELSEIVKKRNNVLTITKKGEVITETDQKLFSHIFEVFCTRFNWPYFDGHPDERIGQMGFGFSLILLNNYGRTSRNVDFYTEKYYKAFGFEPEMKNAFGLIPSSPYPLRTFNRFLDYFGFVELEGEKYKKAQIVTTTPLFHSIFKVRPHHNNF